MSEKRTFIILSDSDLNKLTAPQIRLLSIARGVLELGYEVIWILNSEYPEDTICNDPYYRGIKFISLWSEHLISYNKLYRWLYRIIKLIKLKWNLNRIINEDEKNVTAGFIIGKNVSELLLSLRAFHSNGIKVAYERTEYPYLNIHKLSFRYLDIELYFKLFLRRVDYIYVISTALKDLFEKKLPKQRKLGRIQILNMLVEPDRFNPTQNIERFINSSKKRIVFVGELYGDKDGVYGLVQAFLKICIDFPESDLILVGDNKNKEALYSLYALINNSDFKNRIIFTGKLNRSEIAIQIKNSYCLVLDRPNNIQAKYGFPTKLGEYLASGKPVIITKVGDIPLYLTDNINVYLAEPDNIGSFSAKLRECLSNPIQAQKIGLEGQKLAYNEFNYLKCVHKMLEQIEGRRIISI